MIVELTGPVGAGKSAVARGLPEALRARGISASHLDDVARFSRPRAWLWNARFAIGHPRLTWAAWRAASGAPLPRWHKRLILGLVLGVGGRIEYARRRVPPRHVVLVDEGLVHRAVNLFGWYPSARPEAVRRYISMVPLPDGVIVVDTDPDLALERVRSRGLPKRLVDKPVAEVAAFVAQAREVTTTAIAATARRDGVTMIRIRNRNSLRRAISDAARSTSRLITPTSSEADMVFRPTAPMLSRPDRAIARILAGRAGSIHRDQLRQVLEAFGINAMGHVRILSAPGSRGATVRVAVPGGDVVVKRYKASIDPAALDIEHAVLQALAAADIAAPRLRATMDGRTSLGLDGSCFAVFEPIRGYRHPHELVMAPRDRQALEVIAGRLLARLHAVLQEVEVPASESLGFVRRGGLRVREVEWYADRLAAGSAPRRIRAWATAALWQLRETFDAEALPLTVVHGDYAPYNLMIRSGRVPVVVDFELARLDWRLVDLATGLSWFAQRRRRFDVAAARRMLNAYAEASDALDEELARIPDMAAFLALQRASVAWSRAESEPTGGWETEARHRILMAEDLLAGRHPLNAVVRRW
ncbi:MAG TPA: phosphotransferase [Candidatus Limnocylindria bacterium]|jgi:Ser/Thr protein kinase RdoA (MazF antagonist)/thymidylate kinase